MRSAPLAGWGGARMTGRLEMTIGVGLRTGITKIGDAQGWRAKPHRALRRTDAFGKQ